MKKRDYIVYDLIFLMLAILIALVSIIFIGTSTIVTIRILFLLVILYKRYRDCLIVEYYLLKVRFKPLMLTCGLPLYGVNNNSPILTKEELALAKENLNAEIEGGCHVLTHDYDPKLSVRVMLDCCDDFERTSRDAMQSLNNEGVTSDTVIQVSSKIESAFKLADSILESYIEKNGCE